MLSCQEIVQLYKELQGALHLILPEQGPELTVFQGGSYPLLLLETSADSAGFAVIDGTPESTFNEAYNTFKKLYREMHSSWKGSNISFVICRSEERPESDAFFSYLENDVYFCRKYVIRLHHSAEDLKRELLRLPFLPLPKDISGWLLRPPSAQTLLQDLNVSAKLARWIVVPQEYSANRIVDHILDEKEPLPPIHKHEQPTMRPPLEPTECMRVRSVEIEAFRAYKKRQVFDVDADIVVLYGPNGLGKTSFFDAFDYACTGRIGRLGTNRMSQERFSQLASHLSSSPGDGFVSVQLNQGTADCTLRRIVADWRNVLIDDEDHDRASALQFLTSAQWGHRRTRIENLVRLFRATHLFSQSAPELLSGFERESTLAPDLVSRMLALDDYASGLFKAKGVLDDLKKRINQSNQLMNVLNEERNHVRSQIGGLQKPKEGVALGRDISRLSTDLVKELAQLVGLTVDEAQPTVESAREWRAIVDSTLKVTQDRLRQIQTIEASFTQFDRNRSALQDIVVETAKLDEFMNVQAHEQQRQNETLSRCTSKLEQESAVLEKARSRLSRLKELSGIQDTYQKTAGIFQHWQQELKRATAEKDAITTQLTPALAAVNNLRNLIIEHEDTVRDNSQKIEILSEIQNSLPSWLANREQIQNLQKATIETQLCIDSSEAVIDKLKREMTDKEQELAACEIKINQLFANQEELTRLLDQLEAHVNSGICPACGTNHESKATLIKRMHNLKQARPPYVDEIVKRRSDLQISLKQENASLAAVIREQSSRSKELREISRKLLDINASLALFEGLVAKVGLQVGEDPSDTIARKIAQQKGILQLSQKKLARLESELADARRHVKGLEQTQADQETAQKRAKEAISPLEKQIADLHTKAEKLGLSLDITPQELATEIDEAKSHEAMASKRLSDLAPQQEKLANTLNVINTQIRQARERIGVLSQEQARLDSEIGHFRDQAAAVLDRDALTLEGINKQRKLTTERVDQLHALHKRCSTLEMALDAAQLSAMHAELEYRAESLASKERALIEDAERISTVKKWFERVRDALDRQSSSAVANYVEALGPLTTLIQKRLRAVYNFNDVNLRAKGNEINVIVDWGHEHVKPGDYFSDSQNQILMLSLFLAGRLTQTWSGFAPILMDDPVTHFDDLNAFGFVELIRGLASTSPGKRQFFISTCENRLFDLMKMKFRRLKGGARFYKFESIGSAGPIVNRVE